MWDSEIPPREKDHVHNRLFNTLHIDQLLAATANHKTDCVTEFFKEVCQELWGAESTKNPWLTKLHDWLNLEKNERYIYLRVY